MTDQTVSGPLACHEEGLRRDLKPRHLQLIALGGIIGSGYFLGTGAILSTVGPAAVLSYVLGGIIVICVMLCLGELAVACPVSSSFVTYARQLISPTWACGVGWSYLAESLYIGQVDGRDHRSKEERPPHLVHAGKKTLHDDAGCDHLGRHVGDPCQPIEFWLALIKVAALVLFVVCGLAIFFGTIGSESFIGTSLLLGDGGFFPAGYSAVLITMVLVLVNFQGAEIIGLAAGESENPARSISVAIRNVTWRIISLYVVPLLLLVSIFPWRQAGLEQSVFAAALDHYGLRWAGGLFSFVVLTAAVSCSNSGLYGCARAMYALGQEGLAPSWLGRTNRLGVPQNATLFSVAGCWVVLMLQAFDPEGLFVKLLAVSGFSGAIAWISICWSQLNFRRRLEAEGHDVHSLTFKVRSFPTRLTSASGRRSPA
jgi:amino acid transporter, AAT family